jgi:hypothetical protein
MEWISRRGAEKEEEEEEEEFLPRITRIYADKKEEISCV